MSKPGLFLRALSILCIIFVLLSLFACAPAAQTADPEQTAAAVQTIPPSPKPERAEVTYSAKEILAALTAENMQGRVVGSEGNRAAAEYIENVFESLGLLPAFESGYIAEYAEETVDTSVCPSVTLIAADGTETELVYGEDFLASPAFENIDIQAPISREKTECENGDFIFFAQDSADVVQFTKENQGRVAIYNSFNHDLTYLHRINNGYGLQIGLINGKAYSKLREAEQVRIQANKNGEQSGIAWNVGAYIAGSGSGETIVVMAHFDGSGIAGKMLYPSAYDNASGVTAMLRTAALCAQSGISPKQDIIFAAVNGEESGMDGARALNDYLSEKYGKVNCINIDCVGHLDRNFTDVYTDSEISGANPLANEFIEFAPNINAQERCEVYSGDNRVMHTTLCITLADLIDATEENVHSPLDKTEFVDAQRLEATAETVAGFIAAMDGNVLDKPESTTQQENSANLGEKRLSVIEQYSLKENEFVCLKEGKTRVNFFFGGKMDSAAAITAALPAVVIPEEICGYKLDEFTALSGWMKTGAASATVFGTDYVLDGARFSADLFEPGKVYSIEDLRAGGALSLSFDVSYASDSGGMVLNVIARKGTEAQETPAETDAGTMLGDETFSGINLLVDGDACLGAEYYPADASALIMFETDIPLESLAEILKALDIKGIVEGLK